MAEDAKSNQSIDDLRAEAARASRAYEWQQALRLCSQALGATGEETPPLSAQTTYDLLDGRAECYRHLGNLAAEETDLAAMAALTSELADPVRQVRVMHRQVWLQIRQGRLAEARGLPVLHTERGDWHFTVLFSNTARAPELGRTHDWVVIYYQSDREHEGQRTVVTETHGTLTGKRVVRGRETECRDHYALEPPRDKQTS